MSTDYHDPIESGSPANSSVINTPLAQLDQAIKDITTTEKDGHIVQASGSDLAQQQRLNFAGYGVSAANDAGNSATKVLGAPNVPNARLTLTTATPVTISDVTAATALYYTPLYGGNFTMSLDDGTGKESIVLSPEISISLAGLTANKIYDAFVYNNAGTLTLELLAWSTDSARATALGNSALGFLVKSGDVTRRYVGTIRITGTTGQCEDSVTKRFVWNLYNRRPRNLYKIISGSWAYTTATWRQANADAANKVEYVIGLREDSVSLQYSCDASGTVYVAIGINTTSTYQLPSRTRNQASLSVELTLRALVTYFPALGYSYAAAVEFGGASGNFNPAGVHGINGVVLT